MLKAFDGGETYRRRQRIDDDWLNSDQPGNLPAPRVGMPFRSSGQQSTHASRLHQRIEPSGDMLMIAQPNERSSTDFQSRQAAQQMRSQGLIGWVLFNAATGVVLHLYRSLATAESAVPTQNKFHGTSFRVLGVHAGGAAYEQIQGKATQRAVDRCGRELQVPLSAGRIARQRLRKHVAEGHARRQAG